ncbi:hypothetical protein BJH93_08440 [Kocuria polaris]|nr:hypothetical protein [Kocuria polaris]
MRSEDMNPSVENALIAASLLARESTRLRVNAVRIDGSVVRIETTPPQDLSLPREVSIDEAFAAIEDAGDFSVDPGWAATPFPSEPLTPEEKWWELLRDLGQNADILADLHPGGRYESIIRSNNEAVISLVAPGKHASVAVSLTDGVLPVGLGDDLAEALHNA